MTRRGGATFRNAARLADASARRPGIVILPTGRAEIAGVNNELGKPRMTGDIKPHYEVVVIGAGVSGIYQIKRLADLGIDALVLDAAPDLGGTWYWNRYPGARFDSESYTYGYSFSKELLEEWHWKERFSAQPENLRYLKYVTDKFDMS